MVARLVIAAPSSGSGKTTVATGLMAALAATGLTVSPHKVGPDYIDPGYHALATGRPGRNLDAYLCGAELIAPLFAHGARGCDIAVVEGVMGLYDGAAGQGELASTAQVAKLLRAPVVLVVDASSQSRSVAALVHGFASWDPGVRIGGVILNKVASERHEVLLRSALDESGVPVLGALRRAAPVSTPSRHLGLVPVAERRADAVAAVAAMAEQVRRGCDLAALVGLARSAPGMADEPWDPTGLFPHPAPSLNPPGVGGGEGGLLGAAPPDPLAGPAAPAPRSGLRPGSPFVSGPSSAGRAVPRAPWAAGAEDASLSRGAGNRATSHPHPADEPRADKGRGEVRDQPPTARRRTPGPGVQPVVAIAGGPAFTFSYAEHAELLTAAGADVVVFDPLRDEQLPDGTAGLVIGGGFPEVYAAELSANEPLRKAVGALARGGAPVAAECAGLLYLARSLDGQPMCGVLDADARMSERLTLGYREAVAVGDSCLAPAGTRLRGHEFHRTVLDPGAGPAPAWGLVHPERRVEGFVQQGVHASYLHTHWAARPAIARRFVERCTP
ncbi:cobyrinate a,c-diamide synthase [Streptomyces sp. TLI_146]|uniref:cobyrinate a,c-diamide synthase n=1 Tax=Streptomyces sp. TLI_146 TaxID=1938858 RepID=UPI000C7130F1|nr:cobyrinate a,c-diamide synthase [Streptomyces sp. TLI_146]PKV85033.1 cobyrinic acid a,c-diamide synthase [Streptomyces sp. TLI_146]